MEGARAMIKQGLMDRFGIEEVYGIHNWPGVPVGTFAIRSGPFMAATGSFNIKIEGRGAHASRPHEAIDTVLVGAQLIVAAQQIVARNLDPFQAGLISITEFHAGSSPGVIPQTALLRGSMRGVDPQVRKFVEERLRDVIAGIERMTGAKIELDIRGDYPATVNHPEQTRHAIDAAKDIVGEENVVEAPQVMAGEDFAYMLLERPGCYLFVGNGSGAQLHHPGYDFNDEAIRYGTTFWIKLAERSLNDRGAS
jgi:hippurate hydrolase